MLGLRAWSLAVGFCVQGLGRGERERERESKGTLNYPDPKTLNPKPPNNVLCLHMQKGLPWALDAWVTLAIMVPLGNRT